MSHALDLILTLTGALTAALVLGLVTHRLGLSPIVGYLLAGIAVGPFTPGFVAHTGVTQQLAEIGVILLLFGVGLNLQVKELLSVRKVAVPGALAGIAAAGGLGLAASHAFGWSLSSAVVFGLTISVASTVVVLRVLGDRDLLHTPAGHLALGWLVLEDLFTVVVLVILPVFARSGGATGTGALAISIGLALAKIALLVALMFVVGARVLPAILGYMAKTRSRELFTLTVLVLALGIALGSAALFGASMPLGAFLAGVVVGQSAFGARAASEALPMRDAFAVLFFVSIGMLLDPRQVVSHGPMIAATLAIVLLAKPLVAFVLIRALGRPARTAATVAASLAQIGEFSFIVAAVGQRVGVLPEPATQVLVATSVVSITLNPLLVRLAESWAHRLAPAAAQGGPPSQAAPDRSRGAIVVGYGPVGRTVTRLLRENHLEPTVIELNHEVVVELAKTGVHAIYGDASQREILERAGVRDAGSLVFAASGTPAEVVIRLAKELNPALQILARCRYLNEVAPALAAGAHVVVAAEGEVALAMTEHLLEQLGATSEQLDRARERVRREMRVAR